ncbi:MAG: hypothetical protein EOM20_07775 [Spartobacteria bacterium]|nr:hypothetical protein [Spartobacteria bacterium]
MVFLEKKMAFFALRADMRSLYDPIIVFMTRSLHRFDCYFCEEAFQKASPLAIDTADRSVYVTAMNITGNEECRSFCRVSALLLALAFSVIGGQLFCECFLTHRALLHEAHISESQTCGAPCGEESHVCPVNHDTSDPECSCGLDDAPCRRIIWNVVVPSVSQLKTIPLMACSVLPSQRYVVHVAPPCRSETTERSNSPPGLPLYQFVESYLI